MKKITITISEEDYGTVINFEGFKGLECSRERMAIIDGLEKLGIKVENLKIKTKNGGESDARAEQNGWVEQRLG